MEQGQEDREDIQDREVVLLRADHRFSKGVVTGVLAAVCVMLLLATVGVFWLHGRISQEAEPTMRACPQILWTAPCGTKFMSWQR